MMRQVRSFLFAASIGVALCAAPSALSAVPTADHLVAGAATPKDAELVAGPSGASYELRGGAVVEFAPGTTFVLEPSIRVKLRKPGDPETVARSVRIVTGRAEVTIPARYRDQTAVFLRGATKLSAVAKEGRVAFVSDDERATAASRSGEMLVGIGNEWKPLKEGFARTLAPEDPTALVRPIPAPPEVRTDHGLVLVSGTAHGSVTASWSRPKDGAAYDVALVSGKSSRRTSTADAAATFSDLGPGSYEVRVASVDKYGLASAPAASTFRVVGVTVPEGASVAADGAITLGRDQRVSLVGASGLEVSYGASPVFVSAPATLGLAHNGSTTARLRLPGAKEEASVLLEPRGLRANVAIGPKIARWPLDRVAVDVELFDANGRPVPEDAEVTASVTVNLAKVELAWTRNGRMLHAELSPGTTPGPWVVRAEVHDAQGDLIGRDFLEVAAVPSSRASATASR